MLPIHQYLFVGSEVQNDCNFYSFDILLTIIDQFYSLALVNMEIL